MSLIQAKCNSCGANLEFDDSRDKVFCSNCGSQYIRDNPLTVNINNINIGNVPATNGTIDYSFDMQEYATPFVKDERQAKQDWLCKLMTYSDAPLDIAYKAKVISVSKEYFPIYFMDVNCSGDWQAMSYWEHDEPYQEIERHRKLNGEIEYRTKTKHKWIIDAVQQTKDTVPPKLYQLKFWMTPNPDDPTNKTLFSWISLESNFIEIDDKYLSDYKVEPISRDVDSVNKLAENHARDEVEAVAKSMVPGDRYENFSVVTHVSSIKRTTRYLGVYHIKYDYCGKEYDYYSSCEDNDKKAWFIDHPKDANISNRSANLKQKAKNKTTAFYLWLFGTIFLFYPVSNIPGMIILAIIKLLVSSKKTISSITPVVAIISAVLTLAVGVFFTIRSYLAIKKAKDEQKNFHSNNDELKKRIHDLIQDDSIPDDNKSATIEKWINS